MTGNETSPFSSFPSTLRLPLALQGAVSEPCLARALLSRSLYRIQRPGTDLFDI